MQDDDLGIVYNGKKLGRRKEIDELIRSCSVIQYTVDFELTLAHIVKIILIKFHDTTDG